MKVKLTVTDSIFSNYPEQILSFNIYYKDLILPLLMLNHGGENDEKLLKFINERWPDNKLLDREQVDAVSWEVDIPIEELLTSEHEETRQWAKSMWRQGESLSSRS
jgi:hypothetical protein